MCRRGETPGPLSSPQTDHPAELKVWSNNIASLQSHGSEELERATKAGVELLNTPYSRAMFVRDEHQKNIIRIKKINPKEGRKERSCQVCSPSLFLKVFNLKPRQSQGC